MESLIFYTDPHLGLNRLANTTPTSRALLRQRIFEQVARIHDLSGQKVCCGDLFDTFHNDEDVLLQGLDVVDDCELVLAGNHDVTNRKDTVGSLQFLARLHPGTVDITPFGKSNVYSRAIGNAVIRTIPHVASQELFEQALKDACSEDPTKLTGNPRILLLHCNYESPFAGDTETTLNLTEGWAEKLLEKYDYILMGHEHQPRDLFQGRLIILGNTHPTGFADISDKRIALLGEDGKLTFQKIWDAKTGYLICKHAEVPESTEAQFVRITGKVDAGEVGRLTKAVARLWKGSPSLLAVKLDVQIQTANVAADGARIEVEALPAVIRRELQGSPMLELFEELLERAA